MFDKLTSNGTSGERKPGIYTTEFWTTVAGTAYMVLNTTGVLDQVSPHTAAVIGAALVGAYNVSRGVAKHNNNVNG